MFGRKNISTVIFFVFLFYFQNVFCEQNIELISAKQDAQSDANSYFSYLKASYQHRMGKPNKSLRSFEEIFSQDKINDDAFDGFIRLLFDINQFGKIVNIREKKLKGNSFKDNLDIQLIFALSYLNLTIMNKAENLFLELNEKYPDNVQVAYYAAISYIKSRKLQKALNFINKCISRLAFRSKHFLFHFLASKIYMSMGMRKKALNAIKNSLSLYSEFGRGWLLKALLEEQQGKINEAISGYKNFLGIVGRDLAVEKQLVYLLFRSKRFKEAAETLGKMKLDSPAYYFDLALIEWEGKNYKSALENINRSFKKLPDFKRAKLLKIEILFALNKKQEVLDFLQDWLKNSPRDNFVIHTLLLLKRVGITTNSIIKVFETIAKKAKKSIGILSVLADLYLEQTNFKKVLYYSNKLLSLVQDNGLKSKIFFQIGYVYFITEQKIKVEKTLKKAMKYKPTYPSVYNLLAYYYAQNDKKLQEALRLSELALKSDPDCYYYLDTKGFILLKLKEYEKAIKFLQKALNLSKSQTGIDDEIIGKHLHLARKALNI